MGSRMVLIIAPTTMHVIEYFGDPSARIKLLITFVVIKNGTPKVVIRVYSSAKGIIVLVAPNDFNSGSRNTSTKTT